MDRLLSDDEMAIIYGKALDEFAGHMGFMRNLRDAQDARSFPLGEESGRAEAFEKLAEPCEHRGPRSNRIKRDCAVCWGQLKVWGTGKH